MTNHSMEILLYYNPNNSKLDKTILIIHTCFEIFIILFVKIVLFYNGIRG